MSRFLKFLTLGETLLGTGCAIAGVLYLHSLISCIVHDGDARCDSLVLLSTLIVFPAGGLFLVSALWGRYCPRWYAHTPAVLGCSWVGYWVLL